MDSRADNNVNVSNGDIVGGGKMVKIQLTNIGRGKFCGVIECDKDDADSIAEAAYREARKYLSSRDIETTYNPETNKGIVMAGFHSVGVFTVISQ